MLVDLDDDRHGHTQLTLFPSKMTAQAVPNLVSFAIFVHFNLVNPIQGVEYGSL